MSLVLLGLFVRGQDAGKFSIGVEGGVSYNSLHTDISNRASTSIQSLASYSFGIPVQYRINHWLAIEAAPNLTQKNYSINRTDTLSGIYQQFNNTYIQLPVTARFSCQWKKFEFFANAGIFVGYWIGARVSGKVPDILSANDSTNAAGQTSESILLASFDQKYSFNSQKDARLEFGYVGGAGIQYPFKDKYHVFVRANYYYSLTTQQKNYYMGHTAQYNDTFTFTLGGLISL